MGGGGCLQASKNSTTSEHMRKCGSYASQPPHARYEGPPVNSHPRAASDFEQKFMNPRRPDPRHHHDFEAPDPRKHQNPLKPIRINSDRQNCTPSVPTISAKCW
jgi:hypothetical protein